MRFKVVGKLVSLRPVAVALMNVSKEWFNIYFNHRKGSGIAMCYRAFQVTMGVFV